MLLQTIDGGAVAADWKLWGTAWVFSVPGCQSMRPYVVHREKRTEGNRHGRDAEPEGHHMSAAGHHEQPARCHREAARCYEAGEDYTYAAQEALTAHGHGLRALEHGLVAGANYAAQEASPLPSCLSRSADTSASTAVASPITLSGSAHHIIAAGHHDAAEQHHEQAGRHCNAEQYVRANHENNKALDHGKHALFHCDQAAMYHMEHYTTHASAELV